MSVFAKVKLSPGNYANFILQLLNTCYNKDFIMATRGFRNSESNPYFLWAHIPVHLKPGLEKVWYPGILVTSQYQIWQPILAWPKALSATI